MAAAVEDQSPPPGPDAHTEPAGKRSPVNWPVFIGSAVIIVAFVLWAALLAGSS